MEPARSGLYRGALLLAIVALLLAGAALRLSAFLALAGAWAAYLVVAWISARRPLRGVSVKRELYPSAFENDEVPVELVLEGPAGARMIEVADLFGPSIAVEQRMLEPGPLEPGTQRRLTYVAYCSRHWGLHPIGPVELVSSDAAGLFHASRRLPLLEEFAVFPQVYDVAGLSELGARASFVPQEQSAGRPGQSPLPMGVRDYRAGDDLRRVHWPATARRGALMVKELEVDLSPYTTVFLDFDRRHRAGTGRKSTLEYVVRTGASVIWTALKAGGFVQVEGMGAQPLHVPPGKGRDHLDFALYELIRASQDGKTPFHEAILTRLPRVPARSTAVLVSGSVFIDLAAIGGVIEAMRSRGTRAAVFLVNNFSFPAISGWPPPRVEIVEKTREAVFYLRSRGVPVRVLEESDELETALGKEGFSE